MGFFVFVCFPSLLWVGRVRSIEAISNFGFSNPGAYRRVIDTPGERSRRAFFKAKVWGMDGPDNDGEVDRGLGMGVWGCPGI